MSSVQVESISTDSKDIPFQAASLDIWDKKYRSVQAKIDLMLGDDWCRRTMDC